MAVLRLNHVQLVSQGEVVLVPLLDLEDLGLQLGDQQVLLVAGQVHAIVVLHARLRGKGHLLLTSLVRVVINLIIAVANKI